MAGVGLDSDDATESESLDPEGVEFEREQNSLCEPVSGSELQPADQTKKDCTPAVPEEEEEEGKLAQKLGGLLFQETMEDNEEGATSTVAVEGLKPSTTDESIQYFFENPFRSGGGPVQRVERLAETTALVHFEDRDDAESVRAKPRLELEGSILHASRPGHRHESLATETGSLSPLTPAVPDYSAAEFCEHKAAGLDKAESSQCNACQDPGHPLSTEAVTRKQTIPNLNVSQLKMLNNPKVLDRIHREFPGVEVCVDVDAQTAHMKASEKVAQQLCSRVQSLIDCVGEVKVPVSPALLKMHDNERHKDWIWRTVMDDLNLVCHWEAVDQCLVICAPHSSLLLLERLFRSLFVEIRLLLEEWEVHLLRNRAQPSWVEVLQKHREEESLTPVLLLDKNSVVIADTPSAISQTQLALRQFLDQLRNKVTTSWAGHEAASVEDSHVCKEIPNLKAGQLKVLSCPRVVERWYRDCPDLQICVHQQKKMAVIKASETTMKRVFVEVMYFVTLVREVGLHLSPALVKMYEKEESRKWVDKMLVDSDCRCHWELCDQHVVISAQSSQLCHLEEMFQFVFKEVTVHLEQWEQTALTSDVWTSFLEDQQKEKGECPSPVLMREDDRVIIVDIPERVEHTHLALTQLLKEHRAYGGCQDDASLPKRCLPIRICEDCIPNLTPGQLSIVSMARALGQFYKQFPGLTVSVDREEPVAVVRAPQNIMQEAFSAVLCYVALLKETRIPLSPPLIQMYEKEENREWIRQSLVDKYELVCHWDVCEGHLVISGESARLRRLEQMFKSLFQEVKVRCSKTDAKMLTLSLWELFVDRQLKEREDSLVPVVLFSEACVTIVDIPSRVSRRQEALQQLLVDARRKVLSSPDTVGVCLEQKTISDLTPGQVRVLSCKAAFRKLHKEYPGLQISVDRESKTVNIHAPEVFMAKAFAGVLTFVNDIRELKVTLSPALAQMFEKADSRKWIQRTLIEKYELVCHWELCDQHLVLSAQSVNLFRLDHLFKSVFKELRVSLKEWARGTLTPSMFKSYVREQERDRAEMPTPVLLLNDDSVTIVDVVAKAKETQLALVTLMNDLASLEDLGSEPAVS